MALAVALTCCWLVLGLPGTAGAASSGPKHAWAQKVSATWAKVAWTPVQGARRYEVYRGSHRLASTRNRSVRLRRLAPSKSYDIRVLAVTESGRTRASRPVPFTTSPRARCNLHAAPTGRHGAAGTAGDPIRTVRELSNRLGPGKTGCLRGSFRENLTIRSSGTSGKPVVLRNRPGHRASIRGRMWIPKSTHDVVVFGLKIDARNVNKLPSPTINGSRIKFIGNRISNHRASAVCLLAGSVNGWGIARSVVLERNRIYKCGKLPANNHQHGIYLENTRDTRVTNNVIVDNANRGIQLYPNAQRTLIARNVIARNGQGIIFSGTDGYASSRTRVQDNVISHARIRSNVEYWYPAGHRVGKHNHVRRNCVYGARQANISKEVGFVASANPVRAPRYRKAKKGNFGMRDRTCARLVGTAAPLRR